jgi:hypothetical protein
MRSTYICKVIIIVAICSFIFTLVSGCSQPGETAADVHRRHLRTLRIDQQEMNADIDKTLLLDRPSKLTEKRIY